MSVKVVSIVILSLGYVSCSKFSIGGIFYQDDLDFKAAFRQSAIIHDFEPELREVSRRGEILEVNEHVCSLAQNQVIGIIDGIGGRASEHVQALCDLMELPHVAVQHNELYSRNWSLINLYPSPNAFNNVLEQLIILKDWNNFTILYVKGRSFTRVSNLLKMGNDTDRYTVTVRELSGDDYRDVLINAKEHGYHNFVVDSPSINLEQLLLHAQQVGLMSDEHSYIFVSPDLFTLNLDRYRFGGVNMTGFRLVNLKQNDRLYNFTEDLNAETGKSYSPDQMKTKLLLIYDAMLVFSEALKKVDKIEARSLDCEKSESWFYGSTLLNFMKSDKIEGITRTLAFDGIGQRHDVIFDILELTPAGNQTIGIWHNNNITLTRPFVPSTEIGEGNIMRNKTFKVLIALTPPYAYEKQTSVELEGNDRYEGFTVDLIDILADRIGFNYEFETESDYGAYNVTSGVSTGMVQKIMEDQADFAICDFTMTVDRQAAIDFSMPFMSLGVGILYKQPSKQPPEMFSFMAVFSDEVWYYVLLVQLGLGVIMIFIGRISHKEWQNPVPCIEQPEELSNQFSFANSVWLIIGSVLQQGSEIAPIAIAPRMVTSVWWFFTMVVVASYTGTLVAFLTVEKNVLPFNTVEELASQKSISYGAKSKGSTIQFFQTSTNKMYQDMYKLMKSRNWLVENNDIGVERAETTNYAVFMESTGIEYYKERHCDLLQIGGLLDSKSYGIGMKKGSPYKRYIDEALLFFKESGKIQKLKDIWWKEKRGGGKCEQDGDNEEPKQLGMKNMIGAFVVLGVGLIIGLFISILDMLWGVFKRTVKYKTTYKYELIEELKFALKFSGDTKPVRRASKASSHSNEVLTDVEAKDEVRSLKSIKSGRSTDTHRTQHSHSSRQSRHSPLSVAFARRREYN